MEFNYAELAIVSSLLIKELETNDGTTFYNNLLQGLLDKIQEDTVKRLNEKGGK